MPLCETIYLETKNNIGEIRYTFPSTNDELQLQEHLWFCPSLFSMFKPEEFFKLLVCILLEGSVIFVSD